MMGLNLIAAAVVGLLEMIVLIEIAYSKESEPSGQVKFRIKRNDREPCSFNNFLPTYCQQGEACVYNRNNAHNNYNSCKSVKKDAASGKLYIKGGYNELCSDFYGFRKIDDLESCRAAAKLIDSMMIATASHRPWVPGGCNLVTVGRMLPAVVFNNIPGSGRRDSFSEPICQH